MMGEGAEHGGEGYGEDREEGGIGMEEAAGKGDEGSSGDGKQCEPRRLAEDVGQEGMREEMQLGPRGEMAQVE